MQLAILQQNNFTREFKCIAIFFYNSVVLCVFQCLLLCSVYRLTAAENCLLPIELAGAISENGLWATSFKSCRFFAPDQSFVRFLWLKRFGLEGDLWHKDLQNNADFSCCRIQQILRDFLRHSNNRAHLILKSCASNTCNASLALLSWVVDVFLVLIHLYAFSISDRNGQMPGWRY